MAALARLLHISRETLYQDLRAATATLRRIPPGSFHRPRPDDDLGRVV